ncbi:N-acetylneuraminate synthase [Litchfieldia salsa]|uniref:N-acetylneuraminate synthase n=1 Tax=Litchfieldia salsa TaxID=930152 RepID=A0A1H0WET7_9BACI|nr:N-acetylneuraminate synthase [Litchfieldia salsa]
MQTYIIAEAGVNHNGSLAMAKELINKATEAGVDAVKFQTFKAEKLVTKSAMQAEYQIQNLGEEVSQYEMLKKLELTYSEFIELKEYCEVKNITFLSSPFDKESVDFLIKELQLPVIKISSGELNNAPLLHYISNFKVKLILSTGMAEMKEVHNALAVIAYGLAQKDIISLDEVNHFYESELAKKLLKDYVTILHCTTEYPTPPTEVNLRAINYLKSKLELPVGFSDHSEGISIPIAAVAAGAEVIEKHFTLNRDLPGPDHKASLEPLELAEMVKGIRIVEKALGNPIKEPTESEIKNKKVARKSLVAATTIKKGDVLTEDNITVKRPGVGISPFQYWDLLGRKSKKDYQEDELLHEDSK